MISNGSANTDVYVKLAVGIATAKFWCEQPCHLKPIKKNYKPSHTIDDFYNRTHSLIGHALGNVHIVGVPYYSG